MNVLTKMLQLVNINIRNIFASKKFLGILIFLVAIDIIPSLVTYTMAVNPTSETAKMYLRFHVINFISMWEQLLFSQIFSIIIPIFLINISLIDQIRLKRIYNLIIRPVKRETIFLSIALAYLAASIFIGMTIGLFLYITVNIAYLLSMGTTVLDASIIIQLTVFFAVSSFLYGTLMSTITLTMRDYGLKAIIIFFFLTLLYDLVMSAIGGTYNYFTVAIYKLSILSYLISDKQLRQYLINFSPVALPSLSLSLSILITVGVVFALLSIIKFRKIDIE
ncbi:MAG: hypothetical protein ACP6IP_04560 [Candidatus Njordarchaeia archaeon]